MKQAFIPLIAAAALSLTLRQSAPAQTLDGSMLFNPNIDLSSGTQNSYVGTVGGIFLTTYSYWPEVNYLGYYDEGGDGLANSHLVTLWDNSTGNVIASATVPSGTTAPLVNGYRWVELSAPITLSYGSYYAIGAQADGVDLWGDLISNNAPDDGSNGQIAWSDQYVQLGSGWEFTRAGRYDDASNYPTEPSNQTSAQDSIYPVANLGFNIVSVPEPASLSLVGMGIVAALGLARKTRP